MDGGGHEFGSSIEYGCKGKVASRVGLSFLWVVR